jgi:HEAT repeat protein
VKEAMQDAELALRSDDPEERRRAVAEIAGAPEVNQARLFIRALGDPDWRVRKEAVGVARNLAASRDVLDALVQVLGPGDNVGLRNAAVEALGTFGTRTVDALRSAVRTLDADGRKLASEALAASGDAAALGVLEGLLLDDDSNVRAAAIEGISGVGAADVDRASALLERCLVTDDALSALAALEGLNRLGVRVAWPMLKPHLRNPLLRDALVAAAGLSGHPDAATYVVRALDKAEGRPFSTALRALATFVANEPSSRRSARAALGSLGEASRRSLLREVREGSDDLESRRCALLVVGALGTSEAAEAVLEALSDDRIAAEAEQALEMLGPAAILALARRARAGQSSERAACVEQLGQLADESSRAIACQAILDATEDGTPEVVRAALVALAKIGDEGSFGLAVRWLSGEASPAVRQAAAASLAACAERYPDAARSVANQCRSDATDAAVAAVIIGVLDAPVFASQAEDVQFLADAASNESAIARRAAIDALGRFGGPSAVEAASFGLTDEAPEVQLAAVRALGRMRDETGHASGIPHLLEVARALENDDLGVAAIEALGETSDAAVLEVLRGIARTGTAMRAVAAVEAIGRIDAPGRVDAVIHALSHTEPEVVKAALRAIAHEEPEPRALAHVATCLDHDAWDVRRLAAELLGRHGDTNAKVLLRRRLVDEREPLVRDEIQRSLAEFEGATVRRTMPPLGGGLG